MHFFVRQKFLSEKLGDLREAMPLQWSVCFLHHVTYRTPCHPSGHLVTESATDLRKHVLLSGVFYLELLPAVFKASPELAVQPQS